jgi:hypothetical protein
MTQKLSIETAQVEIHVVRVGGHKMTLATFRQIPEVNYWEAKKTYKQLGWIKAPAPWPDNTESWEKETRLNPDGHWLLCVDPNGTLKKVPWPSWETPPGKQIYTAT